MSTFLIDFADVLIHTVGYRAVSGRDAYGKPTYAASQDLTGRVTYKQRRVVSNETGQEELSQVELWIAPLPSLRYDDEFTLPDGSTPKILAWHTVPNENGNYHTKVFFGGNHGT